MSSQTKIFVLRMKELIYTFIFIGLGLLLVVLFLFMFSGNKKKAPEASESASYIPGVYSASIVLNGAPVDVTVTVDADRINGIQFVSLDDSISAMYPLMEPALEDLTDQIMSSQSLNDIIISDQMKYTQTILVQAIQEALEKAAAR